MKLKVLMAGIMVCVAAIAYLAFYVSNVSKVKEQSEQNLARLTNFVQMKRAADSLFVQGNFDAALEQYEEADAIKPGSNLKQNAHRVMQRIQHEKRKADSISTLNKLTNQKLKAEAEQMIAMTARSEARQRFIDSILVVVYQAEEKLVLAEQERTALAEALVNYKSTQQFLHFIVDDTIPVYYLGTVKDGEANGFGYGLIASRGVYEGEWKDNRRHGKGKYTWRNNHVYEGDFKEGRIEGYGIYYFDSGEKYEGNWKGNLRDGYGTHYGKDGSVLLQGAWAKDKFKEKGRPTLPAL